jgi:hypothetical protein
MSDHEDVLRRTLECCRAWDRDVRLLGNVRQGDMADAINATLAELAALRSEVGILSAAKAGARYIAERDTLRQRLAEVERTPQALGTKIPDYWHEAKTLWPWLPSQPAIQLDDEWRNRTRAENALWLIEQAEQRAERAETALLGIRSLDIEGRLHFVSERNLCPLCQCRIGQHMPECSIGRLRAALAPVAEPTEVQGHWWCPSCRQEVDAPGVTYTECHTDCGQRVEWVAPVAEQPADARNLPAGTLVTCEYCPEPHPKDDDGTACRYPKVADHV